MAAQYPSQLASFGTRLQDNIDTVLAAHPGKLQDEVLAIQTVLGVNPQVDSGSADRVTVNARLNLIEAGVTGDSHSQYVKVAGGSTITPASSSTKGLVVKGASSQTANLQEWQTNGSSTPVAYITPAGGLVDTQVTADINNLYVLNYVFG
jgi:hypothetical protein